MAVRTKSKCIRGQYGAVLVNEDNVIVSTGFNDTPFGVKSCEACAKMIAGAKHGTDYDVCRSIHAEENAIIFAGRDKAKGASLYLYGQYPWPCIRCKRVILNAGIKRMIAFNGEEFRVYNPLNWVDDL